MLLECLTADAASGPEALSSAQPGPGGLMPAWDDVALGYIFVWEFQARDSAGAGGDADATISYGIWSSRTAQQTS